MVPVSLASFSFVIIVAVLHVMNESLNAVNPLIDLSTIMAPNVKRRRAVGERPMALHNLGISDTK